MWTRISSFSVVCMFKRIRCKENPLSFAYYCLVSNHQVISGIIIITFILIFISLFHSLSYLKYNTMKEINVNESNMAIMSITKEHFYVKAILI